MERERILSSSHHNLHALPAHPDDGGGAGWEVVDDAGSFVLISSRTDEFAIDGIDVDVASGRGVVGSFYRFSFQRNNVFEAIPGLLAAVGLQGRGWHVESSAGDVGVSEGLTPDIRDCFGKTINVGQCGALGKGFVRNAPHTTADG